MRRLILGVLLLLPALAFGQTTVQVYPSDSIQSGCALASAGSVCPLALAGKSSARFLITATSGPPSGISLVAESSADGTNWSQRLFIDTETGNTLWTVPNAALVAGYTRTLGLGGGDRFVRIRCSALGSGTVTVLVTGTDTVQRPDYGIVRIRPVDPQDKGAYMMTQVSGTMAAGLAAGSTVWSMRWTSSTSVAAIRRVTAAIADITTGFTAGTGKLLLYRATSFSASDTGGTAATITSPNGKKDTTFAATGVGDLRISSTAALTAGTRTLDGMPLGQQIFPVSATANAVQLATKDGDLLQAQVNPDRYPVVLRTNEGLILQATVPATGTWNLWVTVEWDELASFP